MSDVRCNSSDATSNVGCNVGFTTRRMLNATRRLVGCNSLDVGWNSSDVVCRMSDGTHRMSDATRRMELIGCNVGCNSSDVWMSDVGCRMQLIGCATDYKWFLAQTRG
ncbi:hypothetical protein O6H91_01G089800 [Diphasiastrum complanatum]|uniref:Uncharacterized protein n=1 Tax=Diphasiastrum complanatum TaxID=34168 RepID=A0ACC2ET41_DIPCM|nr:hypothetical protein O6H91_01G089800 [Diphasiastrum complanatum]